MPRGNIKRVTVMLPDDVHRQLKLYVVSNDTTLQDSILQWIKDNLTTPEETTVEL